MKELIRFSVRFTGPRHAWPHHHQLSKRYVRNRVQPIFHTRKSFPFFLLACLSQDLKPSVRFGAFDWGWDGAGILDVQMCAIYYEGQECFYRFFLSSVCYMTFFLRNSFRRDFLLGILNRFQLCPRTKRII